ncbi:MAG: FG-GAP-like repeat-containing protein, partial [Gemmatimonadota bacterium]|nr:FG-GAP-like repeat-containing protein [Gemmatimonadota bacterium]
TNKGQDYSTVTMAAQGGLRYSGNIPGQASGIRVRYFVSATDTPGHNSRAPYYAPDLFLSFSVDDSVPCIESVSVLPDTSDSQGPYPVSARAWDNDSLRACYLVWAVYNDGALTEHDSVSMEITGSDTAGFDFTSQLAGRRIGTRIDYYVRAVDLAGNCTLYPSASPDSTLSFRVSHFSEKSLVAGRSFIYQGTGVAVSDYDRDGHPDLFLANRDTTDRLLRGLGADSTFTDAGSATLGASVRAGTAGFWGDYNNDNYPDLYIVTLGSNVLLSNDGDGTFTDITASAGVGLADKCWSGAWVDYNRDGLLDLFVVSNDGADRLYRNEGDSTFTDMAAQAGLTGASGGVACSWADYDNDCDQDLYVVYYGASNRLYRNNDDGTFTEVTSQAGVAGGTSSTGAVWFDCNNDCLPDLYLVEQAGDILYLAGQPGVFSQADLQSLGLDLQPGGFGAAWGDFDNDSHADLFKARGETGKEDLNAFFRGLPDGTFEHFTYESGITDYGEYRGAAWTDYDSNGRLDLVVNNQAGRARLYRNINPWPGNGYLRVRLLGTRSNAPAIGAQVRVFFNGKSRMQQLGGGSSFAGHSEPVVHFGLGETVSQVDSMLVLWPSGITQRLGAAAAGQTVLITEKDTLYPRIVALDTIADLYVPDTAPRLSCRIIDIDGLTTAIVRYRPSSQDSFTTAAMSLDSLNQTGSDVISYWHFDMPILSAGSNNIWRIVATNSRSSMDSTLGFRYYVREDILPPEISFITSPESVLPDTSEAFGFVIRITDQAGVSKAGFYLQGLARDGNRLDSIALDTTFTGGPCEVEWSVSAGPYSLGTAFSYNASAGDISGHADTLPAVDVLVSPLKGKASLSTEPTNVTDLLRLVHIILGSAGEEEPPSLIDTLGLNLDLNGTFDTEDLEALLDLWEGTGSGALLLAASGTELCGPVTAGLDDHGERGISFFLDNPVAVPYGFIELEIESPGHELLRLIPGQRLFGLPCASGMTGEGRLCLLFMPDNNGRGLAPGRGALFTVSQVAGGPSSSSGRKPSAARGRLTISRVRLGVEGEVTIAQGKMSAGNVLPRSLTLDQNVPNPFNPSTTIRFGLPAAGETGNGPHQVSLDIFNLRGALVRSLIKNSRLAPGYHSILWDGADRNNRPLSSGVYFYRLMVEDQAVTRKMILLK